jgi:hypothetical protein
MLIEIAPNDFPPEFRPDPQHVELADQVAEEIASSRGIGSAHLI